MFYICIQTKFYIKTFTFVFRQYFIFEYKGKCFIFVFKQSFISKHLPLYSNKVLYQNIYLCIQTKVNVLYLNTKVNVLYLNTKVNVLYLNTKVNVLYQNIYLCIQTMFYTRIQR